MNTTPQSAVPNILQVSCRINYTVDCSARTKQASSTSIVRVSGWIGRCSRHHCSCCESDGDTVMTAIMHLIATGSYFHSKLSSQTWIDATAFLTAVPLRRLRGSNLPFTDKADLVVRSDRHGQNVYGPSLTTVDEGIRRKWTPHTHLHLA